MKYVCPKCGKEVQMLILPTHPAKSQNHCFGCGWRGQVNENVPIHDQKVIAE
jgi:DNA-directed RNA polymerase subunit RPC12/RpoP